MARNSLQPKTPLILIIALMLSGCGSDSRNSRDDTQNTNEDDTNDTEATCSSFDPDKVYLLGTYAEGAAYLDSLVDPENPILGCTGFGTYSNKGAIMQDGSYIYEEQLDIFSFVYDPVEPDQLTSGTSNGGTWSYPDNPTSNDILLHTVTATGCGVGSITPSPTNSNFLYTCPNDTWYRQDGTLVEGVSGNMDIYALLSNDSVLTSSSSIDDVQIIDITGVATDVTFIDAPNLNAKLTGAKHTNQGLWLTVKDDNVYTRWLLQGSTATQEGQFASISDSITIVGTCSILDGEGNLWCPARDSSSGSLVDIIVKRPLTPSESVVVYTELDEPETTWPNTANPFVFMHISYLVTGP